MAKNPRTSADEKQKKSSPDADPSATTSAGNLEKKRIDSQELAERLAENLHWWQTHPEAMMERIERDLLRGPGPYIPTKERGGDDESK